MKTRLKIEVHPRVNSDKACHTTYEWIGLWIHYYAPYSYMVPTPVLS